MQSTNLSNLLTNHDFFEDALESLWAPSHLKGQSGLQRVTLLGRYRVCLPSTPGELQKAPKTHVFSGRELSAPFEGNIAMNEGSISQICFSPVEAARQLGIARSSVFKLLASGKLKAKKLGTRTLIRAEDLHQYVESLPTAEFHAHLRKGDQ